jgi:excisionase family DNA binding protein
MTETKRKECGMETSAMLAVHGVARLLGCSTRTVYRLVDSGRMPRPVKLGALVRWPREVVESWIASGCPSQQKGGLR